MNTDFYPLIVLGTKSREIHMRTRMALENEQRLISISTSTDVIRDIIREKGKKLIRMHKYCNLITDMEKIRHHRENRHSQHARAYRTIQGEKTEGSPWEIA